MLAIVLGLLGAVLGIWLLPAWLTPWVVGIGVLLWAWVCVVPSGYPVLPTLAWAIPVAIAVVVGLTGHSPATQGIGFIGFAAWITLYLSKWARWFWYVRLFRWRPQGMHSD